MKINSILLFVVIFGATIIGTGAVYTELAINYDAELYNNASEFTRTAELYENINSTFTEINNAQGGEEDSNFLSNINSIWKGVKLMTGSFSLLDDIVYSVGEVLRIPPFILYTILTVTIIGIITLLINIATRWRTG